MMKRKKMMKKMVTSHLTCTRRERSFKQTLICIYEVCVRQNLDIAFVFFTSKARLQTVSHHVNSLNMICCDFVWGYA